MSKRLSRSYYFEPQKIIRDLVHGYVNVTEFELKIIDTIPFQRLKDIRQLTCQHVYPSAQHTRFEHSLGVLALTRQAIKCLNKNGMLIHDASQRKELIIDDNLQFNVCIAALLHDIGHCPFSHLGESEFDAEDVYRDLLEAIKDNDNFQNKSDLVYAIRSKKRRNIGKIHEQLSCIVILKKYSKMLSGLFVESKDDGDSCDIQTDYELIIRCILGMEYKVSTVSLMKQNGKKNLMVRLINSKIFDMDKLDYIMRDSALTGIGMPAIDTQRLFRNMYLDNNYSLVFTSRAIPVLQNMIDSRDGLYLYVYNHHAVVFSDFMNTYIVRKLSHNARDFLNFAYSGASDEEIDILLADLEISSLGLIPKPYLFSVEAIVEGNRSDSDWISLLNVMLFQREISVEYITQVLQSKAIAERIQHAWANGQLCDDKELIKKLAYKIERTFKLIYDYKTRNFLKPWWKTVFEFSNFMMQHFRDDYVRKQVSKWICNGGDVGLDAAEMRSQIAKHVIYIEKKLYERGSTDLKECFGEGDFFVVQRSNRFFDHETIEKLKIAFKASEIIGLPADVNYRTSKYYIKNLTNIIPQKDYSSIYTKAGFFVFSKSLSGEFSGIEKQKHYKIIEQIFVFVSTEFVDRGEQEFIYLFCTGHELEEKEKLETNSMEEMYKKFNKQYI